jgi:hypothetical protein
MTIRYSYPPDFAYEDKPSLWQNPRELNFLLRWFSSNEVQTILEIGIGYGHFGKILNSHYYTVVGIDRIKPKTVGLNKAYKHIIIGNSTLQETIEKAREYAPYDVVFIDGNHSESVVALDFDNYSGMAKKAVIFHDIAGNRNGKFKTPLGVKNFWRSIKKVFPTIEMNDEEPYNYGIGIIEIRR